MSDLIDRQAAIDRLTEYGNGRAVFISVGEAIIRIEQLPPAQPERIRGRWILAKEQRREDIENDNYMYNCSNCDCGDLHSKAVKVSYCWNCGAKMEVNNEDN